MLSSALEMAVDWYDLPRNVARRATVSRVEYRTPKALSREEATRLLHAAEGHVLFALWHLLLSTGLRKGEALALRWEDIDWEKREIHIRGSLARRPEGLVVGPTKTKGSTRTIPVDADTIAVLRDRQKQQLKHGAACGDSAFGNLVFTTPTGRPIDPKGAWDHLQRLCRRAGLDPRSVHALRHTSGSLMIDAGADSLIVARVMGHTSTHMTNRYVHPDDDTLRKAVPGVSAAVADAGHARTS
jgi:integrase